MLRASQRRGRRRLDERNRRIAHVARRDFGTRKVTIGCACAPIERASSRSPPHSPLLRANVGPRHWPVFDSSCNWSQEKSLRPSGGRRCHGEGRFRFYRYPKGDGETATAAVERLWTCPVTRPIKRPACLARAISNRNGFFQIVFVRPVTYTCTEKTTSEAKSTTYNTNVLHICNPVRYDPRLCRTQ